MLFEEGNRRRGSDHQSFVPLPSALHAAPPPRSDDVYAYIRADMVRFEPLWYFSGQLPWKTCSLA